MPGEPQYITEIKKKLNPKQLLFAQNLAEGMNQAQAYREAGYAKKAADANAARLIRNDSIQKYRDWLRLPKENAVRLTAEKVHEELFCIVTEKGDRVTTADRIRAMSEYNRMTGGYEPERVEISPLQKILDDIRKGR